jgi:hypothetical protein
MCRKVFEMDISQWAKVLLSEVETGKSTPESLMLERGEIWHVMADPRIPPHELADYRETVAGFTEALAVLQQERETTK